MANRGPSPWALTFAGALALLLGTGIYQLHHIEQRLISQGQQIRALGEAIERGATAGPRTSPGAHGAATTTEEPTKVLHPEVPNFLKPRDKHWPVPGARLGGRLVRGWSSGDPKGFNSMLENAAELGELVELYAAASLADRNVWTNPDEWHGELATRVEVTDDFKEFTIYLRPGVTWHVPPNVDLENPRHAWMKGRHPLTAADVVFTFGLIMNPQVENGFMKNYYEELESFRAVDDLTVVIRWKKKQYLNLESTLSIAPMPEFLFSREEDGTPIPKETLGARFNQHWYNNKGFVGAGPYRMASYEPGTKIRLVRNEEYYGDKPAIAELEYPIYTDPNQTLLKLKAHELSMGGLTPAQYREELLAYEGKPKPANSPFFDGRIECRKLEQQVFRYIGWNADTPLFADKRVRRAMTLAFNRQQILESVFVGLGEITTGPFLKSGPYDDKSIQPYPFDLAQARALLAEAGFTDSDGDGLIDRQLRPGDGKRTPFEFTLLIPGSSKEFGALANIWKEDLLKIGVKMNIDAAEWSLMQKRMEEKRFDAFTGGWALGWDMDLFQIWHSSQADIPKGSNRVGFRNKEADAIIQKLRDTFDHDERVRLARSFHEIVHEEQPYTFFMIPKGVFCNWTDVKNVEFSKTRPTVNTFPWWVAR